MDETLIDCPGWRLAVLLDIDWPGQRLGVYFDEMPEPDTPGDWMGSLLQNQADQSGLQYKRNRYYDPQTGQFTQQDPIGLAGGLNVYGFAAGDPVTFSDPFGLCPWCIAYAIFESGSGIYDVYETYQAFKRSGAEGVEALRASIIGGIALGPGNAYLTIGNTLSDAIRSARPRNAHLARDIHPVTKIPFDADGFPDFSSVSTNSVDMIHWKSSK